MTTIAAIVLKMFFIFIDYNCFGANSCTAFLPLLPSSCYFAAKIDIFQQIKGKQKKMTVAFGILEKSCIFGFLTE